VSDLNIEADPAEAGLDKERLERIDAHFARYVADGRLAGWLLTVRRHGRLAHVARAGSRDLEAGLPVTDDTLWRIYSMTKPVTSVAAMLLYEEGKLALTDPVSDFIPSFGDMRVYAGGSDQKQVTVPAAEPVRIWHLLTHTSGLTYGFHRTHPVDAVYRAGGFEWGSPPGTDLAAACDRWAAFPLLFQPGTEWNYSVSTDVLGRVVEVASGQRLDEFISARILAPLGMTDTAFWAGPEAAPRLAALYRPGPGGVATRFDEFGQGALKAPVMLSGGGGLVSTAADYMRFCQMMLNGGKLDGVRLISPRTVELMRTNMLSPTMTTLSPGAGFGLDFAVYTDVAAAGGYYGKGTYYWGGAAGTWFWIDPSDDLIVIGMIQQIAGTGAAAVDGVPDVRGLSHAFVYQAMVD